MAESVRAGAYIRIQLELLWIFLCQPMRMRKNRRSLRGDEMSREVNDSVDVNDKKQTMNDTGLLWQQRRKDSQQQN